MTITPDKVGNDDIHITVTYEDVLGNSKTMEETVGLIVNEEVAEEEAAVEPETSAAKLPVVPIAGVAAIFVIVMIIVSAVKKRNLKKYE